MSQHAEDLDNLRGFISKVCKPAMRLEALLERAISVEGEVAAAEARITECADKLASLMSETHATGERLRQAQEIGEQTIHGMAARVDQARDRAVAAERDAAQRIKTAQVSAEASTSAFLAEYESLKATKQAELDALEARLTAMRQAVDEHRQKVAAL